MKITLGNTTFQTPYINEVPALDDDEFAALKGDIAERGILIPVAVDEYMNVIDGHHRLRIALELGLTDIPFEIMAGLGDREKKLRALYLNLHRRHLTKEKRQELAVQLRQQGKSYRQIGEDLGVATMTAHADVQAAGVQNCTPEQPETVRGKDGKSYPATKPRPVRAYSPKDVVTLGGALSQLAPDVQTSLLTTPMADNRKALTTLAAMPEDTQRALVDRLTDGSAKTLAGAQRLERQEQRKQTAQTLPDTVFNVIYADPAWEYSNTGVHGAANHHYDPMSTAAICTLPQRINLKFAENAVLFLWVTNPTMPDAFKVIKAWGFEYKTNMAWVKTDLVKPGSGFYVRGRHELLFICTRGSFLPLEDVSPPIGSVVSAPVGEHSAKPEEFYRIIERLYPQCNYVELFARTRRPGWTAWGDESETRWQHKVS